MAATFAFRDEDGVSLCRRRPARHHGHGGRWRQPPRGLSRQRTSCDRGETRDAEDKRTLVDLLVEQIEFADVIVLNKVEIARLVRTTRGRSKDHPGAQPRSGSGRSQAPLAALIALDTGLFDSSKARPHPLWHKELCGFRRSRSRDVEYGITNFVYRARRPFHPEKSTSSSPGPSRRDPRQGTFLAGNAPAMAWRDQPGWHDHAPLGAWLLVGERTRGTMAG